MRIHLIRHGEVHNPKHVVYADLPGFALSEHGREQAAATAARLADLDLDALVSSPLDRAVATAFAISEQNGRSVSTDQRLTEWKLGQRWAGVVWEELAEVFPGELAAYLEDPLDLPFSPESLDTMAKRMAAVVCDWVQMTGGGEVAFVSHQDPIHAVSRLLTGIGFDDYHDGKPEHCSVLTLAAEGGLWSVVDYWAPEQ
ncbi:MAG: histidine phosphatase family protein [Acidimicrobiia bacterium]|nr:histidine phosphatase family protein [Acidimicrobiia bacterium]MDX2467435.1 histidine phosphatase family protein [Acidimicrobiia bacterium]